MLSIKQKKGTGQAIEKGGGGLFKIYSFYVEYFLHLSRKMVVYQIKCSSASVFINLKG